MPQIYRDEYGIQFVKTKGGNQVAVAEDPRGRTFFIDKAGNLYYDTGDPSIGAYMVSSICHVMSRSFASMCVSVDSNIAFAAACFPTQCAALTATTGSLREWAWVCTACLCTVHTDALKYRWDSGRTQSAFGNLQPAAALPLCIAMYLSKEQHAHCFNFR